MAISRQSNVCQIMVALLLACATLQTSASNTQEVITLGQQTIQHSLPLAKNKADTKAASNSVVAALQRAALRAMPTGYTAGRKAGPQAMAPKSKIAPPPPGKIVQPKSKSSPSVYTKNPTAKPVSKKAPPAVAAKDPVPSPEPQTPLAVSSPQPGANYNNDIINKNNFPGQRASPSPSTSGPVQIIYLSPGAPSPAPPLAHRNSN